VGERGPKPEVLQQLAPEQRARLDEAIIEGSKTKQTLYEQFRIGDLDIGYRAFCKYATALEQTSRHRYVGELVTKVFGNLPDSDIDMRARGIMMGMLDRIAADVLHDRELKPRDLRHVVQSYDILRKGAIRDAQAERARAEWEAARMAGVAEAAVWIKDAVSEELSRDTELCERIQQAVDNCCARVNKPENEVFTAKLIERYARKAGWSKATRETVRFIWGIDLDEVAGKPKPPKKSLEQVRQEVRDVYGLTPDN
jgi:hypothetical protein